MEFQHIRHGTFLLKSGNHKLLFDPVFSEKGQLSPIPNVPNTSNNPLSELPIEINTITKDCDGIFVSHTHRDHFDDMAKEILDKELPIFCQPKDEATLKESGFKNVVAVKTNFVWQDITISRTHGKHGHGVIGHSMGPVSGFVLEIPNEPKIYVPGDTVWCKCVKEALDTHQPDIAICFSGEARFAVGKPITMDSKDLMSMSEYSTGLKIIAVHMEAWNHCRLTRTALREFSTIHHFSKRLFIPNNGEIINLTNMK